VPGELHDVSGGAMLSSGNTVLRHSLRRTMSDRREAEHELVSVPVRHGKRLPAMSGDGHEVHQVHRWSANQPLDLYLFVSRRNGVVFT
jgi:hypothetical protein